MKEQDIKAQYHQIWDQYEAKLHPEVLKRGFLFQFDRVPNVDLLFVGINPSYDKNHSNLTSSYKGKDVLDLPYFKAFESIKTALEVEPYNRKKVTWTHLDLLVFRETNQRFVSELMKTQDGLDFIVDQLDVAKQLIVYIRPKVIVVSNTMARTLMGKDRYFSKKGVEQNIWMDYTFEFDMELGVDRIKHDNVLEGTPVFFSSMLSGQRALDNGSKERLVWHIDNVLSNI